MPDGVTSILLEDFVLPDAELPSGFRMEANGLHFSAGAKGDKPAVNTWIAAPFEVIGETRSGEGDSWGLLLRWRDREGRTHQWPLPRRLLHRAGAEICEELEHAGLSCAPSSIAHELMKVFLAGVRVRRMLRCVSRAGWHQAGDGHVFVLPGGATCGPGAGKVVLQSNVAISEQDSTRGTLSDWQTNVAALAVGNDRLILAISLAFAAPLLDVTGEPSGGLNLFGQSRSGKTTAATVAASVFGKPTSSGLLRSWRGTANGLESAAAETSDMLLLLDEMGQADAKEIADVVYMLANETGKQRAGRTGGARQRQTWRVLFLSTGELTLAQKLGEAGRKTMAGLSVRLIDLPADAGAGLGLFQNLHGRASAAVFSEQIRSAALQNYGTPIRAYLPRLAEDRHAQAEKLSMTLAALRDAFISKNVPAGADGQVRSVASRFALIAAAGELATDYGVVPWPRRTSLNAATACFVAWLAGRGSAGSAEDAAALAQVRQFLEAHGEARFTYLTTSTDDEARAPEASRTVLRAGFRRRGDDGLEYLVLPETWKHEVCKGIDPARTAELLAGMGFLLGWSKRQPAASVRIGNEGVIRLYRVSGAILSGKDTA